MASEVLYFHHLVASNWGNPFTCGSWLKMYTSLFGECFAVVQLSICCILAALRSVAVSALD